MTCAVSKKKSKVNKLIGGLLSTIRAMPSAFVTLSPAPIDFPDHLLQKRFHNTASLGDFIWIPAKLDGSKISHSNISQSRNSFGDF